LVLIFGAGPLLAALPGLRSEEDLPLCCRGNGQHMCSVRRFRAARAGETGKPGVRARCPFAGSRSVVFARVQSFDAPRSPSAVIGDVSAVRLSIPQVKIQVAALFFGPSKRGPPLQSL